jgi:predicted PurR-regulated permease PerM
MENIYSQQQKRTILTVILLALALFIVTGLWTYLSYCIGSIILYILFYRLYNKLLRRGWRKGLVISGIIFISFVVIILPFLFLSIMLTDKILYYAAHLQEIVQMVYAIEKKLGINIKDKELMDNLAKNVATWASTLFPSVLSEAIDIFVGLGLMYFVLFYMFAEQERFRKGLYMYLPFERDTLDILGEDLQNNIHSNIVGQGVISLIQASMLSLGFWFFDFPDPLFWGIVGFFMSFIPVLGTPLIWLPAGIIALAQGNNYGGVGILLFGVIIIMNIDNVLRFAIASKLGDIHPLITISGVILGVPLFGIMGLVVGPLLISYFILLLRVYRQKHANEATKVGARGEKSDDEWPAKLSEDISDNTVND